VVSAGPVTNAMALPWTCSAHQTRAIGVQAQCIQEGRAIGIDVDGRVANMPRQVQGAERLTTDPCVPLR
jgi:hypothetical protein